MFIHHSRTFVPPIIFLSSSTYLHSHEIAHNVLFQLLELQKAMIEKNVLLCVGYVKLP